VWPVGDRAAYMLQIFQMNVTLLPRGVG